MCRAIRSPDAVSAEIGVWPREVVASEKHIVVYEYKWTAVLGLLLAVAALIVGGVALMRPTGTGTSSGSAVAAQTIDIELGDLFIKPASLTANAGADVTLRVRNTGGIPHDLSIEGGPQTPAIAPGKEATLHLGQVQANMTVFCSIPGHRDAGMKAALVAAPAGSHDAAAPAQAHAAGMSMDASYLAGVKAFPAKTKGLGNQPLQPKLDGNVKVFDLTAEEIDWEVAPGEIKRGMAFNGMIPGPVIRVTNGDRVRIVLHNKLKESTALHFHGLIVPNDQDGVPGITQPLVEPGKDYTYEFTLRNTGTHMYHSHMNAQMQVPAGLLGAFIVDAPGEAKVAHDEIMVLNDGPLGYTINGKGFPATQPFVVKQGEQMRVRYMNEGNQIHPMHLHGMVQTVIALDGIPFPTPYQQDTVMVAPGQRVDVLITASEKGVWAYHCHILSHAEGEQGMFGMVTALIVN